MAGRIDAKLAELGHHAADADGADGELRAVRGDRHLVVVSGQVPAQDGKIAITGKVGGGVTVEQGQRGGAAVLPQRAGPAPRGLRRRSRPGAAGGPPGRLHRLAARLHPACAGDERRLRPGGRHVRRGRAACAHHDRRARPCRATRRSRSRACSRSAERSAALPGRPYRPSCPTDRSSSRSRLHARIAEIAPPNGMPAPGGGQSRSSATPSLRRSRIAARPAPAPAGCRSTRRCATRRAAGRRGADVREVAQLRRIRVRPRLGRTPSSGPAADYYPKLQVAVPFSPVPGPRLLRRPRAGVPAGDARPGAGAGLQRARPVLGARDLLHRGGMRRRWARPAGCSGSACSSIGRTRATRTSTISWRRSRRASARRCGASGGTRTLPASIFRTLRGAEIKRAHWDAFYRFYTSTVDRKWGSAYLTQRFFPMLSRAARRPRRADAGRARRQAGRRRAQPDGRGRAVRPQLGLRRRLAVPAFRALLLPRHRFRDRARAARGSRRARRASTRSSAATCRSRPIPRTGSPIPACAARSAISSKASARRSRRRWRRSPNGRRSGKSRAPEPCRAVELRLGAIPHEPQKPQTCL